MTNGMIELTDKGWPAHFSLRAKERHGTLKVVCPFIKQRAVKWLVEKGHRPVIRIITRFNLSDFAARVSDVGALRWLLEQGASIRGVKGLHAKMYLFGERHAIVTSANLTEAALFRNHEFGFVSQDADVARRCHAYFDVLWQGAGPDLTYAKLSEWEDRLRTASVGGGKPRSAPDLPDEGVNVDLPTPPTVAGQPEVSLPPMFAESEQAFVKFLGTSDNRVPVTFSTFEEISNAGCHRVCAYPRPPWIVQSGAIMFIARLLDDGDIMVFGRAVAIKYTPGKDDATEADIVLREWMENWPHFVRVHHGEFVAGTMANGVRLSHLMSSLGTDSFARTQERAALGEKNIDPRRAYGQQAAVRLSKEGLDWLNARLEQAFLDHGRISPQQLQTLDWPEVTA